MHFGKGHCLDYSMNQRIAYPGDDSDDIWAFVAPNLTLLTAEVSKCSNDQREVSTALRWRGLECELLPICSPSVG